MLPFMASMVFSVSSCVVCANCSIVFWSLSLASSIFLVMDLVALVMCSTASCMSSMFKVGESMWSVRWDLTIVAMV